MPEQRAVGVDDHRGVVVDAGGAPLEDRADDDHCQVRAPAARSSRVVGPGSARPGRTGRRSPRGRNTASGTVPAGRRSARPCPAASRMRHSALARFSLGSLRAGHLDQARCGISRCCTSTIVAAYDCYLTYQRTGSLRYRRHAGAARRAASPRGAGRWHPPRHGPRNHHRRHSGAGDARPGYSGHHDAPGRRAARADPRGACRK